MQRRAQRRLRLVLTGVPGTGKSTLARKLAEKLGCEDVDASEFIKQHHLYSKRLPTGELIVKMNAAERALGNFLANLAEKKSFVAHGHILCEMHVPCDAAVVLRCSPRVLLKRLEARRYRAEKVQENMLAEVLDYCLLKATLNYRSVLQIDNTKPISVDELLERIRSGKSDAVDYSRVLTEDNSVSRLLRSAERVRASKSTKTYA
jgi:adenylate kinase